MGSTWEEESTESSHDSQAQKSSVRCRVWYETSQETASQEQRSRLSLDSEVEARAFKPLNLLQTNVIKIRGTMEQ